MQAAVAAVVIRRKQRLLDRMMGSFVLELGGAKEAKNALNALAQLLD